MKRALRWSLYAMGGAVALFAVLVVVVELMSWNFLKPRIASAVEQATGREFSIEGKVDVGLLPPHVTLNDVALDNPDWAETEHFVEVERLRVAPDVFALLRGQLALSRVDIDTPFVRLIDRADGPPNWVLESGDGDQAASGNPASDEEGGSQSGDASGGPIPVEHLELTDGEVRYTGAGQDRTIELGIPSLRLNDDGETTSAKASLAVEGREVEIDAQSDSLYRWTEVEAFNGELQVRSGESRLAAEFALDPATPATDWQVGLDAEVVQVGQLAERMGAPAVDLGSIAIQASVERAGATWIVDDFEARGFDSAISGAVTFDASGETPTLDGELDAEVIQVEAIGLAVAAVLGGGPAPQSDIEGVGPPPVLPHLDGGIDVTIDRLRGIGVPVDGLQTRIEVGDRAVSLRQLSATISGDPVHGSARLASTPSQVSGALSLRAERSSSSSPSSSPDRIPRVEGEIDLALEPVARDAWSATSVLAHLEIDTARIVYAQPDTDTTLTATARLTDDAARPVVNVEGTFDGRPLDARFEGAPVTELVADEDYELTGRVSADEAELEIETDLSSIVAPRQMEAKFSLSAPGAQALEAWTGGSLPESPPLRLAGRLERDGTVWRLESLDLDMGETSLTGSAAVGTGAGPDGVATFDARFDVERLALEQLGFGTANAADSDAGDAGEGGNAVDARSETERGNGTPPSSGLAALRSFEGEFDLTADRVTLPAGPPLSDVQLDASLTEGRLMLERLSSAVGGGEISIAGHVDAQDMPASARIDTRFDGVDLARFGDSFAVLEERLGRASGRLVVEATESLGDVDRGDLLAPKLGRLTIEPSEVRFVDSEADTDLTLTARTEGLDEGNQRFHIDGEGRYDGGPFSLRFRSDALLDARLPDRPFAVDLDATVVETRIELDGSLLRPLALAGLDLELALAGPNPRRLDRLLGVPLPELPPYRIDADLALENGRWRLADLSGTVGDSDVRGHLLFDPGQTPPHVDAELRSENLDFDDLGGLVGATPATGEGETISDQQREAAAADDTDRFVLPDRPLFGDAWRGVSADVRYRADSVRARGVPLSEVVIDLRLSDEGLYLEPLRFGVGDGRIDLSIELDGSEQPPAGSMSVEMRGVDLRKALADWDIAGDTMGIIGAQGKVWLEGRSVADLLGSVDGGLVMLMTEGQLGALMVELAGLDAGQAFLSWLGDRPEIPINCAYADLQARDGDVELDTFLIDTDDTIFTVGGAIDLASERLDVSVVAHPQDASALVARTPLHLGGTFASIEAGIHGGALGVRAGASLALAALAGPLAAALPLLEAGVDDRPGYCQGLVDRTDAAMRSETTAKGNSP